MLALGALTAVEKNLPWGQRLDPAARRRADPGRRLLRSAGVMESYPRDNVDDAVAAPETRAERRERATNDTRASILAAARDRLLADRLREPLDAGRRRRRRGPAQPDPLPLRQQAAAHPRGPRGRERAPARSASARCTRGPEPLWRQWERACDYLDEDIESGYVRILQEMIAAGWSDAEVAAAVRDYMGGWYRPARRGRRARVRAPRRPRAVHATGDRGAHGPAVHRARSR